MVDELDKKLRALGDATDDVRPTDALTGAVIDGLEEGNPLAGLASATDGLAPGDDFSDAVMSRLMGLSEQESDDPLQRIARATADLEPSDGFTSAVLAAIADQPAESRVPATVAPMATFYQSVSGSARSGLLFAAAAAAACVLLSWYTQRDFDQQLMLQAEADIVEVGE